MCFVRKSLDWVFTRHELKWLDDIIPESHKREKEEKQIMMMEQEMEVDSSVTHSLCLCLQMCLMFAGKANLLKETFAALYMSVYIYIYIFICC